MMFTPQQDSNIRQKLGGGKRLEALACNEELNKNVSSRDVWTEGRLDFTGPFKNRRIYVSQGPIM